MEDLAKNADRIILLNGGEKQNDAPVNEIFTDSQLLHSCGLDLPCLTKIIKMLNDGGMDISENLFTTETAAEAIYKKMGVGK